MASLGSMRLWLTPGMRVKRYVMVAVVGALLVILGVAGFLLWLGEDERQVIAEPIEAILVSDAWRLWGGWLSLAIILGGITIVSNAVVWLNRSLLSNWMPRPHEAAVVLHRRLSLSRGPRIVALGGGSGLSNLLRGLRIYSSNITAVVTASDDGGSSGRLRTAFGMPAPGDLNDCLAALSDSESQLSRVLEYRFTRGDDLKGHTFGNILITTLTEVGGDFAEAIRTLNRILNICGAVYPVSPEPLQLKFAKRSGALIAGESLVRELPGAVESVSIEPENPALVPEVADAIAEAHLIVLGPGSLYTSTIPPLLVPACREALQHAEAPIIYVCNVMTEAGETDDFDAWDHVAALERYLGRYPDMVLYNTAPVDEERLRRYKLEGARVVTLDPAPFREAGVEVVGLPILGAGPFAQHDSLALAQWLHDFAKSQAKWWRQEKTA
jgi:uncharacterized cofD-like protein